VCLVKGATLQHPGRVDAVVGFQPFPAEKSAFNTSAMALALPEAI
jgi:hypothetical protein